MLLDYRFANLAGIIKSAATDKILLIYGTKHLAGLLNYYQESSKAAKQ